MDDKYQVMPPLTDEEYNELKADIAERGVMVPIEFDEDGNILDGYHRYKICQELGRTDYPKITRFNLTEEEKIEHAIALNAARRSLTEEQKKEAVFKVHEEHPEFSLRRIARIFGIGKSTVDRWIEEEADRQQQEKAGIESEEFAGVPSGTTANHVGTDGKQYPASPEQAQQQRQEIRNMIIDNPDMNNHQIAQATGASDHTVERQRDLINSPPEPEPEYPDYPDIAEDAEETEERFEYSIELGEVERNLHNSIVALDTALEYITSSNNQMTGSEEFCRVIADQLDDCEAIINKYRRILRENAE